MKVDEVLERLKEMGTDQNIKTYKKHGVKGDMFGVSIANLKILKKEIKKDSELAFNLWDVGNYDGMILAMLIVDPKDIDFNLGEKLMKKVDNYMTSSYLAESLSKSNDAIKIFKAWMRDDREYYQACAFALLSMLLKNKNQVPKELLKEALLYIKENIHQRKNRAKYSMNNALIAIGVYDEENRVEAISISREVGRVEVDHGDTSCKTPLAYDYIDKSLKRKKK